MISQGHRKTQGIGMTSQRTRARMVERLRKEGITDETVLAALGTVPRHLFVEEALASRAYDDDALPISYSQTISQPYVIALMIQALCAGGRELGKVLEIGTGCGYQAAVLAQVATEVYSIERIAPLLAKARANLRGLRLSNLRLKHADGNLGLPEAAPFDSIIVAAAAPQLPKALQQQLAPGGRLILPLGTTDQVLRLVERTRSGFSETTLSAVRFVPMLMGVE
jgi:protein-L-isoaspartate(D-aspartate) O-methyltransferase